jgi:hypothetical protein
MECAFGGGSTLSHPDLLEMLRSIQKELSLVCNVTLNAFHVETQIDLIEQLLQEKLIYGIGISFNQFAKLDKYAAPFNKLASLTQNVVYHLIAGIHTIEDAKWLIENRANPKILVLGYKQFGNGVNYFNSHKVDLEANLYQWLTRIHTIIGLNGVILSFDNLAIEQLKIRRFFNDEGWSKFYQGDDGFANLYVDIPNLEYAVSSRSANKHKLKDDDTFESIFKVVRKEKI